MADLKVVHNTPFDHGVCDLCGTDSMLPAYLGPADKQARLCMSVERPCFGNVQGGRVELPGFGWWRNEWHPVDADGHIKLFPVGPWVVENTWGAPPQELDADTP